MAPHRPFSDWITDHARGTVNDQLTAGLAQVAEAVGHLEKPGELVLKVRIEPTGSGGRTVATRCTVVTKPPAAAAEASIFYVGEGGELTREDPYRRPLFEDEPVNEPRMPFRDDD